MTHLYFSATNSSCLFSNNDIASLFSSKINWSPNGPPASCLTYSDLEFIFSDLKNVLIYNNNTITKKAAKVIATARGYFRLCLCLLFCCKNELFWYNSIIVVGSLICLRPYFAHLVWHWIKIALQLVSTKYLQVIDKICTAW